MSIAHNKELCRRYFEEGKQNPAVCDEIFAPLVRFHALNHVKGSSDFETNPQSEKETYAWLVKTWGDWRITIDEMIAEGDRVMVSWTFQGTHQGEFHGLSPTQRPVSYNGINIFRIQDGRIVEVWDIFDRLWLWQQLGVLPEIAEIITDVKEKGTR